MSTAIVKEQIRKLTNLEEQDWQDFESILQAFEYRQGHTLVKIGHPVHAIYFIAEGAVKVFTLNGEEEINLDFAFPNMFVTAYHSFITRTPSLVGLETLTDVKGYYFEYQHLQELYQKSHTAERIGRLLAEQQYIRKYLRELSFLKYTAQERYVQLLSEHAEIAQQIPIKYIASYLGIAPESLSRIRKQLSGK